MSKPRPSAATLSDLLARVDAAMALGRADDAEALLLQAGTLAPRNFQVWNNLGFLCAKVRRYADAERHFSRAARLNPDNASTQANLAQALLALGRMDEAGRAARRAIQADPAAPHGHKIAGDVALRQGRPRTAIRHCEDALTRQQDWIEAINSLSSALKMDGRLSEAAGALRRSLAIRPNDTAARNLVMTLTYDPACSTEVLRSAVDAFGALACRGITPLPPPAFDRSPDRRLTIGYLSADLREHPVARNILGLLEHRDAQAYRVALYAHVPLPDGLSRRMAERADLWRPIAGMSDQAAAAQIRADGVDILISLAGWTGDNRPAICAWRPAPLQVSFHDLASSGLDAVDLWVTDATLHPPDTTESFRERLLRLPCFYLHAEPTGAPDPGPLPAGTDGPVTFGSCNNPVKINDSVLDLWAAVLAAVPASRLLLKYRTAFAEPEIRDRIEAGLVGRGVPRERLIFAGSADSRERHLQLYRSIDIALDTWPFNGSTTTFEALYMGVPVLTLAGDRFVSRVGASLLHALGLDALVGRDADALVATAVALAGDRSRLASLRQDLRRRVQASPLLDAPAYARAFHAELRREWHRLCAADP
jgi:predicted O-linked N-acetylglucosamine transferase (SPINDLY family)